MLPSTHTTYAAGWEDPLPVSVSGTTERLSSAGGRLLFLSEEEAIVSLPSTSALPLALGESVRLELAASEASEPQSFSAVLESRSEAKEGRRYRLRLSPSAEARKRLRTTIQALSEKRAAFRIAGSVAGPVEVVLEFPPPTGSVRGLLVDISETGAAVWVRENLEVQVAGIDRVNLTFRPPTSPTSIRVDGVIRNRSLRPDGVRYGVVFDPKGSPAWKGQVEAIRGYVIRLQQEMLRRRPR